LLETQFGKAAGGFKAIDSLGQRLYAVGEVTLTALPEPTTMMLIVIAAAGLCLRRGRAAQGVPSTR
jgi:hypothetical protein